MQQTQTKLTSQRQALVPAAARKALHSMPGSVRVWRHDGNRLGLEWARREASVRGCSAAMRSVETNARVRLLARDDAKKAAAADAAAAKGASESLPVLPEIESVLHAVCERTSKQVITELDLLMARDSLELEVARKAGHLLLAAFDEVLGQQLGTEHL